MDRLIFHNEQIIEATNATVAATLAGVQYGWGIFTTLRAYNGRVFAFERHWQRLMKHAEKARVPVLINKDRAKQGIQELIQANAMSNGRIRLTILKGIAGS